MTDKAIPVRAVDIPPQGWMARLPDRLRAKAWVSSEKSSAERISSGKMQNQNHFRGVSPGSGTLHFYLSLATIEICRHI